MFYAKFYIESQKYDKELKKLTHPIYVPAGGTFGVYKPDNRKSLENIIDEVRERYEWLNTNHKDIFRGFKIITGSELYSEPIRVNYEYFEKDMEVHDL